jgi:RND family efflux transporter MFP subunit
MPMTKPLDPSTIPSKPARARLGWFIVGAGAVAVAISFALPSGDDAAATEETERRATAVTAAPVERATLTARSRYPAELDADTSDLSSFYTGRVTVVHVRVGDLVTRGQVLAEIDPIDAREQIARARAQAQAAAAEERRAAIELGVARRQLERFERLRDQVSASEIDAQRALTETLSAAVATAAARGAEARAGVRLLEKRVVESEIRAPFAGRVAARHVDPGVIVDAGAPLVRVAAIAPLRVRFEVPEQDVADLAVGAHLTVVTQAGAQGQGGVAARVTGVAGEISRDRRVATLEALIEAPPESWLPGMFAQVIVDRRVIRDATVVPASAVLSRLRPDGTIATGVLLADRDVARWLPVKVAAREDDRMAIEAAPGSLAPGARVLVAGHVDLTDGSRIQVAAEADRDRATEQR